MKMGTCNGPGVSGGPTPTADRTLPEDRAGRSGTTTGLRRRDGRYRHSGSCLPRVIDRRVQVSVFHVTADKTFVLVGLQIGA